MQLQNEIDQLFQDTFRTFGFPSKHLRSSSNSTFQPLSFQAKVNVGSDDKNYHINLEVPGLAENDISVDLHENVLTIRGEKKKIQKVKSATTTASNTPTEVLSEY